MSSRWLEGLLPSAVSPSTPDLWPEGDAHIPEKDEGRKEPWSSLLVPRLVRLVPDGWKTNDVGILPDGRQFFITDPSDVGRAWVAVYLFDRAGRLLTRRIVSVEPTETAVDAATLQARRLLIANGGRQAPITVQPFELVHDGERFGLVVTAYSDSSDDDVLDRPLDVTFHAVVGRITQDMTVWVEREPGDDLGLDPPWDSGVYDT